VLAMQFCGDGSRSKRITTFYIGLRFLRENVKANLLFALAQQVLSIRSNHGRLPFGGGIEELSRDNTASTEADPFSNMIIRQEDKR
jgi:hypothetical protein